MDFIKNIFNKLMELAKKKIIQISFCLLFILLLSIYYPSFFYPPRSDHWTAFYFFHKVEALGGLDKWRELILYDPIINTTFRPLNFLILYWEHFIFNSSYVFYQCVNFGLYFISILLLYRLAINFCRDKLLVVAFLAVFSCLFSHFDLICWPYQYSIILSFCLFILGFILYINYLRTADKSSLILIVLLFLSGMLLYEVFFFWPLAIIILTHLSAVCNNDKFKMGRLKAPYLFVLVLTYIPYGLLFLLDRVSRLSHGPSIPLSQFFSLKLITLNGLRVFFDVFYNNFLVNLFPWLAWPLRTDENLKMGGFILGHEIALDKIILFAGSLIIVIFIVAIACLFKKKQLETTKTLLFFLFLLFSELFVLFHCKSLVNDTSYILTQFRFQYIPNALCVLTTLFLLDRFLKSLKIKKMIYVVLSLILVLNILAVKGGISILNQQLMPLGKMLSNIKRNIHNGSIGQYNKLYLEDDLSDYLPNLCWNIYMGERFIAQGGYRWLFSSKEIQYFSKDINDAYWIVDKGDFNVIKKSSGSDFKEIAKINAFQDKAYVDVAKDQRYLGVGWFYLEQGDFKAAEAVFKKAIELNPNGYEAYVDLGRCYNSQGNYVQAEEILKKAITLTSKNKHIYLLLEESYKMQRKYK